MANISTYLAAILSAVYGEDVRGSIHDAIEIINEVSEVVFSTGTDITSASSSSTGYYDNSLYLNTNTYELWKCIGTDTWQSLGVLKGDTGVGISSIQKTSTAGLVDTYTITYTDGNSDTFTVTNGADGADGADGNHIYRGTDISGKAVLPTVYPTSGITDANADDLYLNPSEGAIYSCVTGGDASAATWQYEFTMTGGGGSSYSAGIGINISSSDVISVDPGTIASGENKPPKAGDVYDELVKKVDIDQGVAHAGEYMRVGSDGKLAPAAGGGGMLPYLYIDSEAGATVTVNQPDGTVITPTPAGSGHWECELTGGYGTYVIHSVLSGQGDATLSLAVDTVKEYHVTDTHYDYTINVTAPSGSSIRITGGGETYTRTGTGSSQAFAVHTPSTSYTVAVTMDGNTKSETITSAATSGQSGSVTIAFGTINVTVAADFVTAGSTITCAKTGVNTISKAAASTLTFRVPETGEYTISGTVSGTPYSTTATVTALGTPVSTLLQTTPEGSTVTPTDDIPTWLACGGLSSTGYTTLSQVLADSTTLLALMSDNNAVDYLVRSTTWATDICANSTAMTDIGANNYCANTLLADADWFNAICNSTYFESVLNVKVPTMTSNTTPSGEASQTLDTDSVANAYKAFDGDDATNAMMLYDTTSSRASDIYYMFPSEVKVNKFRALFYYGTFQTVTLKIQGSNDGTNWNDIYTDSSFKPVANQFSDASFSNNTKYKYIRLWVSGAISSYGSGYCTYLKTLQFYGREDV